MGVFHPNGGTEWGYSWDASDLTLNYGVSADVAYTSAAPDGVGALLRLRYSGTYPSDFELYWFNFEPAGEPPLLSLGYNSDTTGSHEIWSTTVGSNIPPDEWHNVLCYVYGEDPVTFQFYFDGVKIGSHVETDYLAPEGQVGLGCHSVVDTYDLYVDNVTQEDPNTSIAPASLGEVKAAFR